MNKICECKMNNGNGIGVCKACGGMTCSKWFGCFIPGHDCDNEKVSKR